MGRHQGGYILPTTALLLVPLTIFAAFAIDFGAWTVQASRLQNAADASALAGAPYLPDAAAATDAALATAAANGYEAGVQISFPDSLTIQVGVTEPSKTFFSGIAVDEFDINRTAVASALAPLRMGSPTNVLGHGPHDLGPGIGASGYYVMFNNRCQLGHYGDIGANQFRSNDECGTENGPNPHYRNTAGSLPERRFTGHFFVIEVPPGADASSLWIFDPGYCPTMWSHDGEIIKPDDGSTLLSWQLWDDGNTIVNLTDDSPIGSPWSSTDCAVDVEAAQTGVANPTHADWTKGWTQTPFSFPANDTGEPQRYLLEPLSDTRPNSTKEGMNYHSYWVRPTGSTSACSTITSATCPTISAETWLMAAARGPSAEVGETEATISRAMDLYLAEIKPSRQGMTLHVRLYDPGEGMHNIQILDPLGKPLDFTWTSDHPADGLVQHEPESCKAGPDRPTWPTSYQGQTVSCVTVHGTRTPRFPSWGSSRWRFDGTTVQISIPLTEENGIDLASYPNHWFSLRFLPTVGGDLQEWGSFSVELSGAPIRLTR